MKTLLAIAALFGIYYFGRQCFPCPEPAQEVYPFSKGTALKQLLAAATAPASGSGVDIYGGGFSNPVSVVSNPPALGTTVKAAPQKVTFGTAPITFGGGSKTSFGG